MTTILFVGSNPSRASTVEAAFHGSTKSSKILTAWTENVHGVKMHINVSPLKTEGNRPLKASEIKLNLPALQENLRVIAPAKIVALGKTAAKALTLLGVEFYEMPHPSGRNRLLNDKEFEAQKVKGLIEYVNGSST